MASKPKVNWVKKVKADNGVSSKGPKMGKAGNSNKLQDLVKRGAEGRRLPVVDKPKGLEYKPDLNKKFRPNPNINRANPPSVINQGHTPGSSSRALVVREAESTAAKVGRFAGTTMKTAGKFLGRANIAVDMIANAQPTNQGEAEWLSNKGPLMRGTKRKPAPGFSAPQPKASSPSPKPAPSSNYSPGPFRKPAPGSNYTPAVPRKPAPGSNYSGAAPAQSTSTMPSSTSAKNPGVGTAGMTGTVTKRGGVTSLQTRYQRDDIAMNSRKKK